MICMNCNTPLQPRTFPSGQRERVGRLRRRRYCSVACQDAGRRRRWADPSGPPWTVNENGCWIWDRALNPRGYGSVPGAGLAHRWVYEHERGPVSSELDLDHLCRNPSCVNPAHLDPVPHAVNCQRGRLAKVTADDVAEIRKRAASGESRADLGRAFGITGANVSKIVKRQTWVVV